MCGMLYLIGSKKDSINMDIYSAGYGSDRSLKKRVLIWKSTQMKA